VRIGALVAYAAVSLMCASKKRRQTLTQLSAEELKEQP
jgi:hypothetical protein